MCVHTTLPVSTVHVWCSLLCMLTIVVFAFQYNKSEVIEVVAGELERRRGTCDLSTCACTYVTVHKQIGHTSNAQKRKNDTIFAAS